MTDYFRVPERWVIGQHVWSQSLADMALDGAQHREGVALWLGQADDDIAIARQCVLLRGPGVTKRHNQLSISAGLMNDVTLAAMELDMILIGQVHSHGPFAGTDLSYPDRYLGITEPGYLSLVAPNFAQDPETLLAQCGVHVHEGRSGWRRMPNSEIDLRFSMPSNADAPPPLIIGDR